MAGGSNQHCAPAVSTGAGVIGQLDAIEGVIAATASHAEGVDASAKMMNMQAQALSGSAGSLVATARTLSDHTARFRLPGSADEALEAAPSPGRRAA